MAPRDDITHTTPEDEVLDLIPNPETEEVLDQLQHAGDATEVGPEESEEPMDEDHPEEEPEEEEEEDPEEDLEWDLDEGEPEEEGLRSTVPISIASPEQHPPAPENLNFSPATYRLADDPYLPPPPAALHPMYRWTWIRRMVSLWRREEGNRIPDATSSTELAPSCPITNEPTHLTIPLLISRLFRHDNQIQELQDAQSAMPSPDLILQLQREVRSLRNDHREIRDAQVHLEGLIANGLTRIGAEVEGIRETLAEMNVRSREQRAPRPRGEGQ